MSTLIRHPKKRGEWVELQFMARATAKGFNVSTPWSDCTRYDFIVEHQSCFRRVQVKSTYCFCDKDGGYYSCRLLASGTVYQPTDFEFLVVYVIPADVWYIIPNDQVAGQNGIALAPWRASNKFRPYIEAWHLLRKPTACGPEASGTRPGSTQTKGPHGLGA